MVAGEAEPPYPGAASRFPNLQPQDHNNTIPKTFLIPPYFVPHQHMAPVPHMHILPPGQPAQYHHQYQPPLPTPVPSHHPPHPLQVNWKAVAAAAAPGAVLPNVQMASAYRIGRYTPAERKVRLERYREKRAQRNYKRRVKYDCRKMIADKRHRVQGRFVKREEEMAIAARQARASEQLQISSHLGSSTPSVHSTDISLPSATAHVHAKDALPFQQQPSSHQLSQAERVHSTSSGSQSSSVPVTTILDHQVVAHSSDSPDGDAESPNSHYLPDTADLRSIHVEDKIEKDHPSGASLADLHATPRLDGL